MNWRLAVFAIAGVLAVVALIVVMRGSKELTPCSAGFVRAGARCLPAPGTCPSPLVPLERGCDAPSRAIVAVPATSGVVGPSDWEAEGRVTARTVNVAAFRIDRFEVTSGQACPSIDALSCDPKDPARAAFGVRLRDARAFCKARGGRLPTEDEWLAATGLRRYPWGDTGAVCRRAAWGIADGPCAQGADGPDTVGAHPDGETALGIHDLAGNVAEWVEACPDESCPAVVRGGSWRSRLATELRTWLRRPVAAPDERDPTIGFRCAYSAER